MNVKVGLMSHNRLIKVWNGWNDFDGAPHECKSGLHTSVMHFNLLVGEHLPDVYLY